MCVVDSPLTPPQPTLLHRGDKLLQFGNLTLDDGVERPRLRHVGRMRGTCPRIGAAADGDRREARLRHPPWFPRFEADIG